MSIGGNSAPQRRQVSLLAKLITPQAWHLVLLMQLVVPQILSIGLIQAGLKAQFPRPVPKRLGVGSWELEVGVSACVQGSRTRLTKNPPIAIKASARDISVYCSTVPDDWRSYELALCCRHVRHRPLRLVGVRTVRLGTNLRRGPGLQWSCAARR